MPAGMQHAGNIMHQLRSRWELGWMEDGDGMRILLKFLP